MDKQVYFPYFPFSFYVCGSVSSSFRCFDVVVGQVGVINPLTWKRLGRTQCGGHEGTGEPKVNPLEACLMRLEIRRNQYR